MTPYATYSAYVIAAYLVSGVTLALTATVIWLRYRKILNRIQNLARK